MFTPPDMFTPRPQPVHKHLHAAVLPHCPRAKPGHKHSLYWLQNGGHHRIALSTLGEGSCRNKQQHQTQPTRPAGPSLHVCVHHRGHGHAQARAVTRPRCKVQVHGQLYTKRAPHPLTPAIVCSTAWQGLGVSQVQSGLQVATTVHWVVQPAKHNPRQRCCCHP
jgi:hypothetical protein